MMILELEETKNWLRVDGNEDDQTIQMLINAAEQYLKNATGKTFDSSNYLAKTFCLTLVSDWYENRELTGTKVGEKVKFVIQSMLVQLKYGGDE
jgi:uncharacterized phage protein (predicted DNA packaging)